MRNFHSNYWPPDRKILLYTSSEANRQNKLINDEEYFAMFKQNRLIDRKILRKLIEKETKR